MVKKLNQPRSAARGGNKLLNLVKDLQTINTFW